MPIPGEIEALAKLGFHIIPLVPGGKIPIPKKWPEVGTDDLQTIDRWERANPDCNWGLVTGSASGVFVIDIDVKSDGFAAWATLLADNRCADSSLRGPRCLTGSGGQHIYFRYPSKGDIITRAKVGGHVGVDVRGRNGAVVVPPSSHSSGNNYTWINAPWESPSIPEAPEWLLKLVTDTRVVDDTPMGVPLEVGARNDTIFHEALNMARLRNPIEDSIAYQLYRINRDGQEMSEAEIRTTVQSAYNFETKNATKRIEFVAFEASDEGNASRLIDAIGKDIIYVLFRGWYLWDGKRWRHDPEDKVIMRRAAEILDAAKNNALERMKEITDRAELTAMGKFVSWCVQSRNTGREMNMIKAASTKSGILHMPNDLDNDGTKFVLNFKNGTLDLNTGKLLPHDRSMLISKLCEHNFNPNAECPMWLDTLDLAFEGNREMIDCFQRIIGYSLSGSVTEQSMFICWGESGNNGKSTILNALEKILGEDYVTTSIPGLVTSKSNEKDNNLYASLARLVGARIVIMSEFNVKDHLNESFLKDITGGSSLQARFLRENPFQFFPQFKLWIQTNVKPTVHDMNEPIWRRLKLIPFDKPIPPEKRKSRDVVDTALQSEAEGIIAWAVRGFLEWRAQGLKMPKKMTDAINTYRDESDIVKQFIDECAEKNSSSYTTRNRMYQAYRSWIKLSGEGYPMSKDMFGRRLAILLDQRDRFRVKGQPVWQSVSLTEATLEMMNFGEVDVL